MKSWHRPTTQTDQFDATSEEIDQFKDAIIRFDIPTNVLSVGLFRLLIALQFTIIGSIILTPWDVPRSTRYIVGFCLFIDFMRFITRRQIRMLVLGGSGVLKRTLISFDKSYRTDILTVTFLLLYLSIIILAYVGSRVCSITPRIIAFGNLFSDIDILRNYGFDDANYRTFTLFFLLTLHFVTMLFLTVTSTFSVVLYDFRSISVSKKLKNFRKTSKSQNLDANQKFKPADIALSTGGMILLVLFVWGVHSAMSPRPIPNTANNFDWAGPFAMVMYSLSEFLIIAIVQFLNRYMVASIQAHSAHT